MAAKEQTERGIPPHVPHWDRRIQALEAIAIKDMPNYIPFVEKVHGPQAASVAT
jgi:hypothetical protein